MGKETPGGGSELWTPLQTTAEEDQENCVRCQVVIQSTSALPSSQHNQWDQAKSWSMCRASQGAFIVTRASVREKEAGKPELPLCKVPMANIPLPPYQVLPSVDKLTPDLMAQAHTPASSPQPHAGARDPSRASAVGI